MKSIKILQTAVVAIFVMVAISGVFVFWFRPEKLDDFAKFVNMLFPFFLAQVIPALIGSPLSEAVRNLTTKSSTPQNDGK